MTDAALLADMRLPLLGLDMAALEAEVERLQLPRFRGAPAMALGLASWHYRFF